MRGVRMVFAGFQLEAQALLAGREINFLGALRIGRGAKGRFPLAGPADAEHHAAARVFVVEIEERENAAGGTAVGGGKTKRIIVESPVLREKITLAGG